MFQSDNEGDLFVLRTLSDSTFLQSFGHRVRGTLSALSRHRRVSGGGRGALRLRSRAGGGGAADRRGGVPSGPARRGPTPPRGTSGAARLAPLPWARPDGGTGLATAAASKRPGAQERLAGGAAGGAGPREASAARRARVDFAGPVRDGARSRAGGAGRGRK